MKDNFPAFQQDLYFLQTAKILGLVSSSQAQGLLVRQRKLASQGRLLTMEKLCQRLGVLSSLQIARIEDLLQNGYLHCGPCQVVFPLPTRSSRLPRVYACPQCKNPLSALTSPDSQGEQKMTIPETHGSNPVTKPLSEQEATMIAPKPKMTKRFLEIQPPSAMKKRKMLGKGGYGEVYQVEDRLSGRTMALKMIHPNKGKGLMAVRFLREIQITAKLEHPHIIPLYSCGYLEPQKTPYYVMQEFRGGTLHEWIKKEEGSSDVLLDIFLKVLDAMAYAHSMGVVHRDLKPANIAVGTMGEVMVMDWGIARSLESETNDGSDNPHLTRQGSIMGTPGYLSPEQARGEPASPESDIFSLGAILYEILTGRPPYTGNAQQRLTDTLLKSPTAPHKKCPDKQIPPELSAIALKALAKEKNARYSSVSHLKQELDRYLQGYSVEAKKDSFAERAIKWIKRNPAISLASASMAAAVLLTLLFFVIQSKVKSRRALQEGLVEVDKMLASPESLKVAQIEEKLKSKKIRSGSLWHDRRKKAFRLYFKVRYKLEALGELDSANVILRKKLFSVEKKIGLLSLSGQNYLLSRAAFERIIRLGFEKAGNALIQRVADREKRVARQEVARVKAIVQGLEKGLPPRGMMDEYIVEIVKMPGPHTVRELLRHLDHPLFRVRKVVIESLGKLGDRQTRWKGKDGVEWLLEKLVNLEIRDNTEEAILLVWALGRLRDPRAYQIVSQVRWKLKDFSVFWDRTKIPYEWIPIGKKKKTPTSHKAVYWFEQGIMKYYKKQYSRAFQEITRATSLNPKYARAYNALGLICVAQKKEKEALHYYRKALEINPKFFMPYLNLANLKMKKGNFRGALLDYNRTIQLKPSSCKAYEGRGLLYKEEKKYQLAIRDFTKALRLNPKFITSYNNRALVYQSLGQSDKALKDYNCAIALNPKMASLYVNRGALWENGNQVDKALLDYQQALSLNPRLAEVYINVAILYLNRNNIEEALKNINRSIELKKKIPRAWVLRGVLWQRKKMYSKAFADFGMAIKMAPNYDEAYDNRGGIYLELGQYQKALADYSRAFQLNSHNSKAKTNIIFCYKGLAQNYQMLRKYPQAIASYDKALFIDPKDIFSWNNRGAIKMKMGNIRGALADFTRSIQANPINDGAYYNRGVIFNRLKQYKKAIADFTKAIEQRKNYRNAYANRGNAYKALGLRKQALFDYDRAIAIDSRYANGYRNRAILYMQWGKNPLAARDFEKYLSLNPGDPQASQLRNYIKKFKTRDQ